MVTLNFCLHVERKSTTMLNFFKLFDLNFKVWFRGLWFGCNSEVVFLGLFFLVMVWGFLLCRAAVSSFVLGLHLSCVFGLRFNSGSGLGFYVLVQGCIFSVALGSKICVA